MFKKIILFFISLIIIFLNSEIIYAAEACPGGKFLPSGQQVRGRAFNYEIDLTSYPDLQNKWFVYRAQCGDLTGLQPDDIITRQANGPRFIATIDGCGIKGSKQDRYLRVYEFNSEIEAAAFNASFGIGSKPPLCEAFYSFTDDITNECTNIHISPNPSEINKQTFIRFTLNAKPGTTYKVFANPQGAAELPVQVGGNLNTSKEHTIEYIPNKTGLHIITVNSGIYPPIGEVCKAGLEVKLKVDDNKVGKTDEGAKICASVPKGNMQDTCNECFSNGGAWTAIGCISSEPTGENGFITVFLRFGVGIGGGIAFLLILWGGFQMIVSSGNPEALNSAKELIGAAIGGLLMIIFSMFLLRLIGFNILGLPGFG